MFDKDKPCFSRPNLWTITCYISKFTLKFPGGHFLSRYRSLKHLYKVPCIFFIFHYIFSIKNEFY